MRIAHTVCARSSQDPVYTTLCVFACVCVCAHACVWVNNITCTLTRFELCRDRNGTMDERTERNSNSDSSPHLMAARELRLCSLCGVRLCACFWLTCPPPFTHTLSLYIRINSAARVIPSRARARATLARRCRPPRRSFAIFTPPFHSSSLANLRLYKLVALLLSSRRSSRHSCCCVVAAFCVSSKTRLFSVYRPLKFDLFVCSFVGFLLYSLFLYGLWIFWTAHITVLCDLTREVWFSVRWSIINKIV